MAKNWKGKRNKPWALYGIPEKEKPVTMHKPSIVATVFSFFIPAKQVEKAREEATPMNKDLRKQRHSFLEK